MPPPLLITLLCLQLLSALAFQASLSDGGQIVATLERSDLQENVTAYAAQISGGTRPIIVQFENASELKVKELKVKELKVKELKVKELKVNASLHGLCYSVSLLLRDGPDGWSKPIRTIPVLTKPLPVRSVHIWDYRESPETGVVFQLQPPGGSVFSRVNISYSEGAEPRYMLYKDFHKGKTVFRHWLPGVCYRNITFMLISEATISQHALLSHSDVTHTPLHHRTVPFPPSTSSHKIVHLVQRPLQKDPPAPPRRSRDIALLDEEPLEEVQPSDEHEGTEAPFSFSPTHNLTGFNLTNEEDEGAWLNPPNEGAWPNPQKEEEQEEEEEEEFVNAVVSEYEDSGWLPPRPPTSYDGFNIYIYRDGNSTETASVDENTHEFFTELMEPGTYRVLVKTLSSAGDCEPRESAANTQFTFYLSEKHTQFTFYLSEKHTQFTFYLSEKHTQFTFYLREKHTQFTFYLSEKHTQFTFYLREKHTQFTFYLREKHTQFTFYLSEKHTQFTFYLREKHTQFTFYLSEKHTQFTFYLREKHTQFTFYLSEKHTQFTFYLREKHTQFTFYLREKHTQFTFYLSEKHTQFTFYLREKHTQFTFYLSASGVVLEDLSERPQAVGVRLLDSSTAAVSWSDSSEKHNGSLVSVISTTCRRPSISQRMENTYCEQENSSSDLITNLTPGAQYRVVVYHTNGPLLSPPSEPVIIDIEPTGVHQLSVFPLSPTAVLLSWQRPYLVSFRKFILQTFFFNPVTLASEWTVYYEIAATSSVIASVRVTDLLPAWYYNFRVSMVTWGDPPLSCCDRSTVSFITAPEAPHISSVDYSHGVLYVRWTYGELFIDLSHSRMLHWTLLAVGKKGSERRFSIDVTRNVMFAGLPLPPGDIYNLTVTACTERSRNTSIPHIIKLGQYVIIICLLSL
ncbi:hypothetical protein NQZ68_035776 [Dissostichus eleginoides]|nr:hypothetical protein NQZ68_035776 [Dissostichus eleginoides]